jgi:hypothetical protein
MVARLAVAGAGLIVMGLIHFHGSGTLTAAAGGVLLALACVPWVVRRKGSGPTGRSPR